MTTSLPHVLHLYHHPDARAQARRWACWFELLESAVPPVVQHGEFHLWLDGSRLELRRGGEAGAAWVSVAELERRTAQGSDLLRACGVTAVKRPRVLDVMAGWGVDGLVLATRGCPVTMIERLPALVALQQDLARRAGLEAHSRCADGYDVLQQTALQDVVYLDPMFPARAKTALPGKRLQWLAELARSDCRPLERWLDAARQRARERVVLKRRRRDPLCAVPDWQIRGRTVRYDVYRGAA